MSGDTAVVADTKCVAIITINLSQTPILTLVVMCTLVTCQLCDLYFFKYWNEDYYYIKNNFVATVPVPSQSDGYLYSTATYHRDMNLTHSQVFEQVEICISSLQLTQVWCILPSTSAGRCSQRVTPATAAERHWVCESAGRGHHRIAAGKEKENGAR